MQLIFETENTNINISLKMSAVDDDMLNEKPLPNGDIKEIVEEVSEKLETNGTSNGENVQNKENILNNGEVEKHKETEDIIVSAEKPSDEPTVHEKTKEAGDGDVVSVDKSIVECPSAEETKEEGDNIPAEKLLEECTPNGEITQAENDIPADIPNKCSFEEKNTEHVVSAKKPIYELPVNERRKSSDVEKPLEECAPVNETRKSGDVASAGISADGILAKQSNLLNEKQKSEQLVQETAEIMAIVKEQPTEEEIPQLETKELDENIKPKETENTSADLDKPSESLSEETCSETKIDSVESEESKESENNNFQKNEDVTEIMELVKEQPIQEEMPQLEIKELDKNIKPKATENTSADLDKPSEKLSEETCSETKIDSVQSEKLKESKNIIQNNERITDKADSDDSNKHKIEDSMEFDEKDGDSFDKDLENVLNDITQSIGDKIREHADDFMEDIEMGNNENVEPIITAENSVQNIDEDSSIKKITEKTEKENLKENVKDESEQISTSILPEIEEQNNMDIDQEPKQDANTIIDTKLILDIDQKPKQDAVNTIIDTKCLSDQASSVITEENEDAQTLSEMEPILSESNKVDNKEDSNVAEICSNSDINSSNSVDNAVEVIIDKVTQNDTTADTLKNEKEIMETDSSEVIELKSGNSSTINSDDVDSSFSKMEEDIISLISHNIEKDPDSTTRKDCSLTPDEQTQMAESKDDASDIEEVKVIENKQPIPDQKDLNEKTPEKVPEKSHTPIIKLSNTMDILSDEEDEPSNTEASTAEAKNESQHKGAESPEKQCINLVDDDDIMLIDEDTKEDKKDKSQAEPSVEKVDESQTKNVDEDISKDAENKTLEIADITTDSTKTETAVKEDPAPQPEVEKPVEAVPEKQEKPKPFIPPDFFKTYRKNVADMTRDDLEEFCILKIVESIIDRSNLNDIRSKLKSMTQSIDEYKKKAMMISKQNRDLQVVLKSVQEEQKKSTGNQPITPLKITRSVGMQVLMTDKNRRRVMPGPGGSGPSNTNANQVYNRNVRTPNQSPRNTPQKQVNNQAIPVPRLVPAGMNSAKPTLVNQASNIAKATAVQNGVKNTSPAQKPEKRTHSRMQSQSSSVTVDLTDDEPPPKVATKTSPAPPVRLVNPQNLLTPRQQFSQQVNSPRKVYIPISINGPQGQQHARPGQTLMLKTVGQGPRPRGPGPTIVRTPQSTTSVRKVVGTRHPAPLPDAMKQYQPPNWKALPPAPDLKLSKVENGIVISWKIEGYQEDSYEDIASYQLYAYQETSAAPSTSLWKKIGDVKALPLPMACTLTQFMAGYKYYFAVRAVDIRSRLGPFSLPGSILLLNKI